MLRTSLDGGGNAATSGAIVIRRTAAIGDAIAATVVADALIDRGHRVIFQTHPNIHCCIRRHPGISAVDVPQGYAHVNLDGVYENDPERRRKHFYGMFMDAAREQLRSQGIDIGSGHNCRPQMFIPKHVREAIRAPFEKYPRPWVFLNPRSETYNVRQVPDGVWREAVRHIKGTCFWIGMHPAPPGIVDLQARHLDNVINWLTAADVLVTVDTGPMHIAAALNTPIVALGQSSTPELHLNDQSDFVTVTPKLDCLNCQENLCRIDRSTPPCQKIDPVLIAQWANARANAAVGDSVSAVVAIWKPEVSTLNQCLSALVDQVDEVIVTAEANSVKPEGALEHPKIRYVRTWKRNIGYSGNINFGARHSNGAWLLLINDDCILKPGAVQKMKEIARPDTGIICNLLRYPDGTIYHAGKIRVAGERGWRHIDYKRIDPTFGGPTELENCCGCCILTRRKVYYQIGGMDEAMPIFSQDDAYALAVRQLGYKILFTPHSEGVHLEHQSLKKLPESIPSLLATCGAAFTRKWGWYLDKNLQTIPGTF